MSGTEIISRPYESLHALVEVGIEDSDTGNRMATLFQLSKELWGHASVNKKLQSATGTGTNDSDNANDDDNNTLSA
jgi:hypothetical protein